MELSLQKLATSYHIFGIAPTGNPQEMYDRPIGPVGFCIASFLKLQSGNNKQLFYNQATPHRSGDELGKPRSSSNPVLT